MYTTLFFFFSVLATATASPLYQGSVNGRGLFDSLNNAVDEVTNVINGASNNAVEEVSNVINGASNNAVEVFSNVVSGASNAVQSGTAQVRDAVATANEVLGAMEALRNIPSDVYDAPIANAALWQQALALDAEKNAGKLNQMFYQIVAWLQKGESSSHTFYENTLTGPAYVAKVLQFVGLPPTQFNQPQAADPAKSLGEYPSYKHFHPLTQSKCNCHQLRNRQFDHSVLPGRGGPIS